MERTGTRRTHPRQLELTERQVEVLRLIEQGFSNSEIAGRLGISLDGAKFHVSEILAKLGVSTREEAVAAWRAGRRRIPWAWILLGLGAVAVAGLVLIAVAIARDASSTGDEPPASLQPPTTPTTAPGFACPPARTPTPTGRTPLPIPPMDGPGSVVFNGRRYTVAFGIAPGMQRIPRSMAGPKFGEVCFDTSTTWPLDPADAANRDGDAFHMSPGTELFTVVGYSSGFRLTAPANGDYYLFEAMPNEGDLARDVLDVSGKVRTINFYRDAAGLGEQLVASTADPAVVDRLVHQLLEGKAVQPPVDSSMNAHVRIQLILADGTETTFDFHPDANVLGLYHVPAEFGEEVRALLAR